MTVPKKKQNKNKLQDEAKSLPTNSKQTNKYTNRIIPPMNPHHLGIFNFSKRLLEKKQKKHVPNVLWVPKPAKREGRRTATSIAVPETDGQAPLVFESSLPKCESFHRYVGKIPYRIDYTVFQKFVNRNKKTDSSSKSIC